MSAVGSRLIDPTLEPVRRLRHGDGGAADRQRQAGPHQQLPRGGLRLRPAGRGARRHRHADPGQSAPDHDAGDDRGGDRRARAAAELLPRALCPGVPRGDGGLHRRPRRGQADAHHRARRRHGAAPRRMRRRIRPAPAAPSRSEKKRISREDTAHDLCHRKRRDARDRLPRDHPSAHLRPGEGVPAHAERQGARRLRREPAARPLRRRHGDRQADEGGDPRRPGRPCRADPSQELSDGRLGDRGDGGGQGGALREARRPRLGRHRAARRDGRSGPASSSRSATAGAMRRRSTRCRRC